MISLVTGDESGDLGKDLKIPFSISDMLKIYVQFSTQIFYTVLIQSEKPLCRYLHLFYAKDMIFFETFIWLCLWEILH